MMRTFNTCHIEPHPVLSDIAALYGKVSHHYFVDFHKGISLNSIKSSYLQKYQIPGRFFNAVRIDVDGKVESINQLIKLDLASCERRIKALTKFIDKHQPNKQKPTKSGKPRKTKKTTPLVVLSHKTKRAIWQKKRQIARLEAKMLRLNQRLTKPSLCFGSKKLFKSQYNEGVDPSAWLAEWRHSRSNQFYLVGSHEETRGNQLCQATINQNGNIDIKLRIPNCYVVNNQKYLYIKDIKVNYGYEQIKAAILAHDTGVGKAITYRFIHDQSGWRIAISIDETHEIKINNFFNGAIGIDFNANHISVCLINACGNPIKFLDIPTICIGKSADQRKAIYGDAVKQIVALALEHRVPIIIESLDFQKKKDELINREGRRYACMLSSFAYNQLGRMIRSRAARYGVALIDVNPAYTSIIGDVKYSKRYGVSVHQSAALAIARRGMHSVARSRNLRLSERIPRQPMLNIGNGNHVTLRRPADGRKHVWHYWARLKNGNHAAFEMRPALKKIQSVIARQLIRSAIIGPFVSAKILEYPDTTGASPVAKSPVTAWVAHVKSIDGRF